MPRKRTPAKHALSNIPQAPSRADQLAAADPKYPHGAFTAEDAWSVAEAMHTEFSFALSPQYPPSADQIRRALPELVSWLAEAVAKGQMKESVADSLLRAFAGLALERQITECLESSVLKALRPDSFTRHIALWHERRHSE